MMIASIFTKLKKDTVATRVGRNSAVPVEIVITIGIVINIVVSEEVEQS